MNPSIDIPDQTPTQDAAPSGLPPSRTVHGGFMVDTQFCPTCGCETAHQNAICVQHGSYLLFSSGDSFRGEYLP